MVKGSTLVKGAEAEPTDQGLPDLCSGRWDMIKALGPRLQHLSVTYSAETMSPHGPIRGNSLSPYELRYCPQLAHVSVYDLRAWQTAQVPCISTCLAATRLPAESAPCRCQITQTPLWLQSRKHCGRKWCCLM